jgi:hypothetical protein
LVERATVNRKVTSSILVSSAFCIHVRMHVILLRVEAVLLFHIPYEHDGVISKRK